MNTRQQTLSEQPVGYAANTARAQAGGQAIIRTCQIFSARAGIFNQPILSKEADPAAQMHRSAARAHAKTEATTLETSSMEDRKAESRSASKVWSGQGWQQEFIGRVFLQLFPTDYLKLFERLRIIM